MHNKFNVICEMINTSLRLTLNYDVRSEKLCEFIFLAKYVEINIFFHILTLAFVNIDC